jgi:CheY-like chemotaxis protein
MMPVMDGFDFLVRLRAEQRWADIPVVVITAKELTEEDRHRLNGHAAHVLSKGMYTRDQLISLVKKTIDAVGEIRAE